MTSEACALLVAMTWDAFAPNLLATVIGAILGVPGGLAVNRAWEARRTEQRKRELLRELDELSECIAGNGTCQHE